MVKPKRQAEHEGKKKEELEENVGCKKPVIGTLSCRDPTRSGLAYVLVVELRYRQHLRLD